MIETIVLDYLKEKGFEVAFEENETLQGEYLLIEKAGGSRNNMLRSSILAIQSYADTRAKAASLNEKVLEAMSNICELKEICGCKENSNYDFTNAAKKKYRYQAVFNIYHY